MKAKYILIHETEAITPDTVFYTVYIGDSDYGRRLLDRCNALLFLTDYYFHRWDAATADFIGRVAASLFPGVELPLLRLRRQVWTERDLARFLRTSLLPTSKPSGTLSSMLCQLDSAFYAKHNKLWNRK